MVYVAAALFLSVAAGLVLFREPAARGQSMLAGGRMGPGCVLAEAVLFVALAIAAFLLHRAGVL